MRQPTPRDPSARRIALLSLLILASVSPDAWWLSSAADPAPQPPATGEMEVGSDGVFVDTLEVQVINVEVFVTDKKGQRVLGLDADDFELLEDGRPVEITNFYAVEARKVLSAADAPPPPGQAEPPADPRLAPQRIPEDQRLHLVVYVDNVNLLPLNRQKSFKAIRSFLHQRLNREDRVMIVSYDKSLKERQPFTSDPNLINDALFEIEDAASWAIQTRRQRIDLLNEIYGADESAEVTGVAYSYVDNLYNDLEFSIRALKEMVDMLAGLPGRKAILYVSDGLPMRAGEDIFHALDDRFENQNFSLAALNYDKSRDFRTLATQASANRIIFYTLDAAGLRSNMNADVETYNVERGSIVESSHVSNIQDPLFYIANETGGQAIVNTNNMLPLLQRVGDDFDTYYSLGYQPPQSGTGRYRDIEVKLTNRKDLRVRHREGYRDKPVAARMADGTLAALQFGYERNPLGIELDFGRAEVTAKGNYLVPMVVKIPMSRLAFMPQADIHRSRLRLYVTAKDEKGETAPVEDFPVPIDIQAADFERAQKHFYQLKHTLLMDKGRQIVAVGARDEVGAVSSFILGGVTVGL